MNIRLHDRADVSELTSLWCDSFGDARDVPERFFGEVKSATLAAYDGGRVIGMANLVPVYTEHLFGIYLYGVCVDKAFRGQGVFRALMGQAELAGLYKNCSFACLIPENETLAETYRRHGYGKEISRYRTGAFYDADEIFCLPDFAAFALPDTDTDDTAYRCGLLKELRPSAIPEKLCFNSFMGEF